MSYFSDNYSYDLDLYTDNQYQINAIEKARNLIKDGEPAGLAIYQAAQEFGVTTIVIARNLGRMGAMVKKKNKQQKDQVLWDEFIDCLIKYKYSTKSLEDGTIYALKFIEIVKGNIILNVDVKFKEKINMDKFPPKSWFPLISRIFKKPLGIIIDFINNPEPETKPKDKENDMNKTFIDNLLAGFSPENLAKIITKECKEEIASFIEMLIEDRKNNQINFIASWEKIRKTYQQVVLITIFPESKDKLDQLDSLVKLRNQFSVAYDAIKDYDSLKSSFSANPLSE